MTSNPHRLHHILDNIMALFMLLAGLVGLSVEVAHLFGFEKFVVHEEDHAVLLAVLGFVAVSLGFERFLRFRAIEHSIEEILTISSGASGCRLLKGTNEIFAAATLPVSRAQRHFRALLSLDPTKAPVSFSEAVAHRLRESVAAGNPIRYEVVFAAHLSSLPDDFIGRLEDRFQIYVREGVGHLVSRFFVDTDTSAIFDMFIIDSTWATISFPTISASTSPHASIVLEDPKIIVELADWFDQRVRGPAQPYEKYVTRRHRKPTE